MLAIFLAMVDSVNIAELLHPSLIEANTILLILSAVAPFFYMVFVVLYWILTRMKKGARFLSYIKARFKGYVQIETDCENVLPDRLANPEKYTRQHLQDPIANIPSVPDRVVDTY